MIRQPTMPAEGIPSTSETQKVTALVCTRNRGPNIVETVQSILANTHPCFELLIVDQSTDDTTAQAIAPFQTDSRLCYLRSDTKGLGRARNIGLRAARSQIVVITDDDCVVPTDWLEKMSSIFQENPRVIVAFCNVVAAPHDCTAGFVATYERPNSKLIENVRELCTARGIGAGLAVRRDPVLAIGGFDDMLGGGGTFQAGEDFDMAGRALLLGYAIYETSSVAVLHYGFRENAELRQLTKRIWTGIGATYAKPLKGGRWSFLVVPIYVFFVMAIGAPLRNLLHFKRPHGLGRTVWFLYGFMLGWRTPIDKQTLCFLKPSSDTER